MPITEQSITDTKKYKIVFCGAIKSGHDLPSVKTRLASAFGLNGESIDKLFPGKAVLVKGNLTFNDAQLFKLNFEKSGALCQLLETSAPPIQPVQTPKPILRKDVPPVAPIIATATTQPPSPVKANNFAFKSVPKKSNTATYIVILVAFIIVALLFKEGMNRPPSNPTPTSGTRLQTDKVKSPRTRYRTPQPPSKTEPIKKSLAEQDTAIFNDPAQYYSITLPTGYTLSNSSSGERSKITFSYGGDSTVTVLASPMKKAWNPEEEMRKRVSAISEGRAGLFSNFALEKFQLVYFNHMDGYQLVMRKGTQLADSFAMVSDNQIAFAVAIITDGTDAQANHDLLAGLVRESLKPNRGYQQ